MLNNHHGSVETFYGNVSELNQSRKTTNDNSQTTNHVYLHPGPNQGEFDNWMRQIGSLLHVASDYAALKPALDLLTATFEPQRMFLIDHPALPELETNAYIEILVVMDENQFTSKQFTKNLLKMACFRQKNVVVTFDTAFNVENGIANGHPHYCTYCKEEGLVFSGSPYRLPKPSTDTIDELKAELPERFDKLTMQADRFLEEAKRFVKNQSVNLAALMLHQCLEYLYKNILFIYERHCRKTHHLAKLQPNVAKFFPQICSHIGESTIDILDSTHDSITAPYYDIGEFWDASAVFEEVEYSLKIAKATFETRTKLLFGEDVSMMNNDCTENEL